MPVLVGINMKDQDDNSFECKTTELDRLPEGRIKQALFRLFLKMYIDISPAEKSNNINRLKIMLTHSIYSLQIMSFLWTHDLPVSYWNDYMDIWMFISYSRFDNICAALDSSKICIHAFLTISLIIAALIIIFTWLVYETKSCKFLLSILAKLITFMSDIILIPTITLLGFTVRHKFDRVDVLVEYVDNNNYSSFEVEAPIICLIFLAILCAFFISICKNIFSSDIRHSQHDKKLDAKSHSMIELYTFFFTIFTSFLYVFTSKDQIIYLQLIISISSSMILISILKYLPYYSEFYTCVMCVKFFSISLVSILFIIGEIFDQALLIGLLTFLLVPSASFLICQYVSYLFIAISQIGPLDIWFIKDEYHLELLLRSHLLREATEKKCEIIELFSRCFLDTKIYQNKLPAIWEANYCLYVLNDPDLAKIKLIKSKSSKSSLEGDYQIFVFNQFLLDLELNDDTKYIDYLSKIEIIKYEDQDLCLKLVDFWKEMIISKPNINLLGRLIDDISDSIHSLDEKYKFLVTNYSRSKECLYFYSTFLQKILCESEQALILGNKLNAFLKFQEKTLRDEDQLNYFDDNCGILFVSWANDKLGQILYSNFKAEHLLKYPKDSLKDLDFSALIPSPYDKKFVKIMADYLNSISDSRIIIPQTLYLKMSTNHILECTLKVTINSVHNSPVIVIIFREKITSHEVALISKSGVIFAHSEKFSDVALRKSESFMRFHIRSIFPELRRVNLGHFKPYKLRTGIWVVLCYFEFLKQKIDYLLLVTCHNEIQQWENGNVDDPHLKNLLDISSGRPSLSEDQSENLKIRSLSWSRKVKFVNVAEISTVSLGETSSQVELTNIPEERSLKFSQSSHNYSKNHFFNSISKKSIKSINIFNTFLILSIVAVLASNIAVLYWTSIEISKASDLSMPLTLGEISNSMHKMAQYSRYITAVHLSPEFKDIFESEFTDEIERLKIISDRINSKLSSWNNCNAHSVFTDKRISFWQTDWLLYHETTNMISALSYFITQAGHFLEKLRIGDTNDEEVSFFLLNGWGDAYHYSNNSLFEQIDCEMKNIEDLIQNIYILLLVGIGVLSLCLILILQLIIRLENISNKFWNKIKQNVCQSYSDLIQSSSDRLSMIHGHAELANNVTNSKIVFRKRNFKNFKRYILRIGVYLAISLFFYFINSLYLYVQCNDLLLLRPELMRTLINSQNLYQTLTTWASERIAFEIFYSDLCSIMGSSCTFSNADISFERVLDNLYQSNLLLRNDKFLNLVNDDYMELSFENSYKFNNVTKLGIFPAGNILMFEASSLNHHFSDITKEWYSFYLSMQDLEIQHDDLIQIADKASDEIINQKFDLIILSLALYAIISSFLYFAIFLPFLLKEKSHLKKMQAVCEIIPVKSNIDGRRKNYNDMMESSLNEGNII